ncbi:hypothetical protein KKH3_21540 [Pectobacterium actinidiae]|nr:hypothetical protein KKH3_21540 [Pectobacterium actinidiae]
MSCWAYYDHGVGLGFFYFSNAKKIRNLFGRLNYKVDA